VLPCQQVVYNVYDVLDKLDALPKGVAKGYEFKKINVAVGALRKLREGEGGLAKGYPIIVGVGSTVYGVEKKVGEVQS